MYKCLVTATGSKHIGLYNIDNSFCYLISILQRLHCSRTLNEVLMKMNENDASNSFKALNCIVNMLKTYAKLNSERGDEHDEYILNTYSSMKECMQTFIDECVSGTAKKGYAPNNALIFFLLPCVFGICSTNEFKDILREIHVYKLNFNNIESTAKTIIFNDEYTMFKNQSDKEEVYKLYVAMTEFALSIKFTPNDFVCSTMEIHTNPDKLGGHAVTLIRAKAVYTNGDKDNAYNYYVIDDQNQISTLIDYYNNRKQNIYEISIRDVDEVTIIRINDILHAECNIDPSCRFSKRMSRFCLCFKHNFLESDEITVLKHNLRDMDEHVSVDTHDEHERDNSCNNRCDNKCIWMWMFMLLLTSIIICVLCGIVKINLYNVDFSMNAKA